MDYAPNVDIAGANDSTFSTDAEKEAYDLLDECNLTAANTLVLYAKTKPETTFYIWVENKINSSGGEGVATSVVGTVENGTAASKVYAVGEHFIRNDKFCTVIAAIASGATLTLNTNYVEGTIAEAIYNLTFYLEQTVTLSTSTTTAVTFTQSAITTSSVIDIAVSEWGLTPEDVTVTTGVCTITMPKVSTARSITVRIYVR